MTGYFAAFARLSRALEKRSRTAWRVALRRAIDRA